MGYKRSSVRTSGTFWGKSPYADGLTYGMYGTDGDYNNSLTYMFGEMTDRFGFMVFTADRDQIEYEDGFDTDYDAEVAAESWIEQNASQYITASVASRNMIASDRDFYLYGDKSYPGNDLFLIAYYGPENDRQNSLTIKVTSDSTNYYNCAVENPEGSVIDTYTMTEWDTFEDAFFGEFDKFNFDEYLNEWLDNKEKAATASRTKTIASDGQFVFYDEKFNPGNGLYLVAYYGPENDKRDSLVLELEGDAATYFTCTVKSPDGTVIDTFTVDDWESYKSEFYGEMDYGILDFDEYLNDWMDRKYGVSAGPNTASRNSSVKKSYISEFDTWGESVDSYNEDGPFHATIAYGEPYNDDNSVTMEAVGDNGVDGPVNCKVLDISWDNVIDTFQAETWDEAVREFEYRCRQYEYDEYLESDDEEFLRLNGIDASRKRAFRKSHRTAKRKMTMKEKLALINEDKLDEEDDPINPFF